MIYEMETCLVSKYWNHDRFLTELIGICESQSSVVNVC